MKDKIEISISSNVLKKIDEIMAQNSIAPQYSYFFSESLKSWHDKFKDVLDNHSNDGDNKTLVMNVRATPEVIAAYTLFNDHVMGQLINYFPTQSVDANNTEDNESLSPAEKLIINEFSAIQKENESLKGYIDAQDNAIKNQDKVIVELNDIISKLNDQLNIYKNLAKDNQIMFNNGEDKFNALSNK